MRAFVASVLLGLGAFGLTVATPNQAQASWLSEALDNASFSINIGNNPYANPYGAPYAVAPVPVPVTNYYAPPAIPAPVCAPAPVIAQRPVYVPVPAYRPMPTPVYRPVPVPVAPRNAYYGPNPWTHNQPQQHGWNGNHEHDWRR